MRFGTFWSNFKFECILNLENYRTLNLEILKQVAYEFEDAPYCHRHAQKHTRQGEEKFRG